MQNLELEITSCDGEDYRVAARSDAGDTGGTLTRFPFNERELGRRMQMVEFALMRSAATLRRLVPAEEQPVQEFGRQLFEFLFPADVREHLAAVRSRAGPGGHAAAGAAADQVPRASRTQIATGSIDKTARQWEVATGRELTRMRHDDLVTEVAFSPDGTQIATGSADGTARLWSA